MSLPKVLYLATIQHDVKTVRLSSLAFCSCHRISCVLSYLMCVGSVQGECTVDNLALILHVALNAGTPSAQSVE